MESQTSKELQKEYGVLRKRELELETLIDGIEERLKQNPEYIYLQQLKEEKEHLYDEYKEIALNTLIVSDEKSSVGEFGKITLCTRESYKVKNEAEIPKEYFKQSVDMDKVKEEISMLGKQIPGIECKVTQYLKITPAKSEGESS